MLKTIAGEMNGIYIDESSRLNYRGVSSGYDSCIKPTDHRYHSQADVWSVSRRGYLHRRSRCALPQPYSRTNFIVCNSWVYMECILTVVIVSLPKLGLPVIFPTASLRRTTPSICEMSSCLSLASPTPSTLSSVMTSFEELVVSNFLCDPKQKLTSIRW